MCVRGAGLASRLFAVLGAQRYVRRMCFSEEAQANDKRAVILTHAFWQRRFGADPKIIGKAVQFGDQTFMPVGVTAPDFNFPTEPASQWKPELFVPLWFRPVGEDRSSSSVHVLARLKPGVTLERAQAEAGIVSARLAKQYPQTNTDRGMRLVPLHESLVGPVRPALLMLFGSVSFVL